MKWSCSILFYPVLQGKTSLGRQQQERKRRIDDDETRRSSSSVRSQVWSSFHLRQWIRSRYTPYGEGTRVLSHVMSETDALSAL